MNSANDFKTRLLNFYRENFTALVRAHLHMGTKDRVEDAVDAVFLKVYENYVAASYPRNLKTPDPNRKRKKNDPKPEPEDLNAYFSTAIKNKILDDKNKEVGASIPPKKKPLAPTPDGAFGNPPYPPGPIPPKNPVGWKEPVKPEPDDLPDPMGPSEPENNFGWKQLLHNVFDNLPEEYHEIAGKLMSGEEPSDLGNGIYKKRAKIRVLICKTLEDLAQGGDDLAEEAIRSFCAA